MPAQKGRGTGGTKTVLRQGVTASTAGKKEAVHGLVEAATIEVVVRRAPPANLMGILRRSGRPPASPRQSPASPRSNGAADSTATSSSAASRKAVSFAVARHLEIVTEFNKKNPARVLTADEYDYEADDARALGQRAKRAQVVPVFEGRVTRSQSRQAFTPFAMPVVLDTAQLSMPELRAELKSRGLRCQGEKKMLQERLDHYIVTHEKEETKAVTGRTSLELREEAGLA